MFTIAQKDHPIRGTATSILLEVQNPYGVSTRFDELADLHLLVSEVLLAISAIVGDSVTLLEAAGGYSCRTTSSRRSIHLQSTVVFDEAQLSELVHEEIHSSAALRPSR